MVKRVLFTKVWDRMRVPLRRAGRVWLCRARIDAPDCADCACIACLPLCACLPHAFHPIVASILRNLAVGIMRNSQTCTIM